MRILFFGLTLAVIIAACNNNNIVKGSSSEEDSVNSKGDVLASNMDTTVDPSQDFFLYANGGWIKRNPIPAAYGSWGIGNLVQEENWNRLKAISENAAKANAAKGSSEQKIGDFWASAMDSIQIENTGIKPLQPYLDRIESVKDVPSLIATVAELKKIGSSTLFADFVTQDDKNSDVMTYKLWQGGIGLPEREYYFKNDSATKNIRKEYLNYITKILTLAGADSVQSRKDAENILAMETRLAQSSRKIEDLRDPYRNYNKMAISELPKLAGNIDWTSYLGTTGVKAIDSVVVGQPEFLSSSIRYSNPRP